jgi:exopolysaccharide production protein ExoZ
VSTGARRAASASPAAPAPGRRDVLLNIQGLRGFAALAVVLVHLTGSGGLLPLPRIGQAGVDVFFVISGFLMVEISRDRRPAPWTFMAQRCARIVPFYWLMTVCVFLIALAVPHALAATTAATADLIRSLLFIPFRKPNGLIQPTLFVGWSLNYEMFFYVCFALGLGVRRAARGYALTAALLLGLIALGALVPDGGPIFSFYTSPLSLEFLAGMAIAVLCPWRRRPLTRTLAMSFAGVAFAAASAVLLLPLLASGPMLLLCGGPAVLLVGAAVRLERAGWRVRTPALVRLGDASFALYLTHPFAIEAVRVVADRFDPLGIAWPVTAPMAVVLALALAIASHRLVERPLSVWAARRIGGMRPRPPAGARQTFVVAAERH